MLNVLLSQFIDLFDKIKMIKWFSTSNKISWQPLIRGLQTYSKLEKFKQVNGGKHFQMF